MIIVLFLIIFLPSNLLAYDSNVQSAPFQFQLPQINTDIIFNFLKKLTDINIISDFLPSLGLKTSLSNALSRFINFWSGLTKTFLK